MSHEYDADDVYYRIIQETNGAGGIVGLTIATMQWFDEFNADKSRFYNNEKYESEAEAQQFIDSEIAKVMRLMPMMMKRMGLGS